MFKRNSVVKLTIGDTKTLTNQVIAPSTTDTLSVGDATDRFQDVYANNVRAFDGTNQIGMLSPTLVLFGNGANDFTIQHSTTGENIVMRTISGAGVTGDVSIESGYVYLPIIQVFEFSFIIKQQKTTKPFL